MATYGSIRYSGIEDAGVAGGGAESYADVNALPSNPDVGELALITNTNKLYVYDGSSWFNIAIVNQAPTAIAGNEASYTLAIDGTPTVVTLVSTDPEGFPLTWSATTSGDTQVGTLTQADNVFTVTPSTDEADVGTLSVTFSVTDGNNTETSVSSFTLAFVTPLWEDATLSIGTSSTNGLDNSTFVDRSTNAHTVTPSGTPIQTAFHPYLDNWSFDTVSTARQTWTGVASPGTGDFTAEAWVYFKNLTNDWRTICCQRATNSSSAADWTMGVNTTGYLYWYSDAMILESTAGLIQTNKWHHVAISRSGTNAYMFIDGQLVDSGTNNYNLTYSTFAINANADGSEAGDAFISNVRFTVGEALYTSTFDVPTEPLTVTANTELLVCASNRFIDTSGNNGVPTVTGSPAVSAFNPFGQESEYAAGENKGSIYTNDDADYLTVADNDDWNFGSGDFTVECWVYNEAYDDTGFSPVSVWGNPASSLRSWIFAYATSSNTYAFTWSTDGGNTIASVSTTSETFSLKEWIHLAVARDGNTIRLFKNGEVVAAADVTGVTFYNPTNTLFITRNGEGTAYSTKGYISDLRIAKGVALYTSPFTLPTAPVGNTNASLYLPMDNAGAFDKTGVYKLHVPSEAADGAPLTDTSIKKYADSSLNFGTMSDDKLYAIDDFPALGTGPYTIEFWMYPTDVTGGFQVVFSRRFSYSGSLRLYKIGTSPALRWYDDFGAELITTGNDLTGDAWNHIAICRDGNSDVRIFIDGVQSGSTATGDTSDYHVENYPLNIGNGGFGDISFYNFAGNIEGFQVFVGTAKYIANFTPPNRTQGITYQAES